MDEKSSRQELEWRAKRIEQYYVRHNKNKDRTLAHFIDEGIDERVINTIIRKHNKNGDVSYKKNGRKMKFCTPEHFERIGNLFKENPDLSYREASKQLGVPRTTIFRILNKMRENNMETHKVIHDLEPRCPSCRRKLEPKKESTSAVPPKSNNNKSTASKKKASTSEQNGDDHSFFRNNNFKNEICENGTASTTSSTLSSRIK